VKSSIRYIDAQFREEARGWTGSNLRYLPWRLADKLPLVNRLSDYPHVMPLEASVRESIRYARGAYGTAEKPQSLAEVPWDYVREYESSIPFHGLREYWYPALPSKLLRNNTPKPMTLLGDNLVFFRDEAGRASALVNQCAHRQAFLSRGQVGVWSEGTITCRYHGWTYDGSGKLVAALTEGPESSLCNHVRIRAYPTEEQDGLIWVYMGDEEPQPVYDSVPHAREVMAGPWKWFHQWDWPVNYLQAIDNNLDGLSHSSTLHATCQQFRHQKLWDEVGIEHLACDGLKYFLKGVSHEHHGPHHANYAEFHVPGYLHFEAVPPNWPDGAIFWTVPLNIGYTRTLTLTSFRGPLKRRLKARLQHNLMWHKRGLPNNIFDCNEGPDQSMLVTQGVVADRRHETLGRIDKAVVAGRKLMADAYAAERAAREAREAARAAAGSRNGQRNGAVRQTPMLVHPTKAPDPAV
jgi:phenylpropionate dioxygenase-like ring-hydroxylating dioxygenase large terminal subunit